MKTVIIYDQLDAELTFFVLNGDYTRFHGVYINQYDDSGTKKQQKAVEKLQEELSNLIYDPNNGNVILPVLTEFPTDAVCDGAVVITAGFLP